MRAEAILFDLDGTLLDTLTDIGASANAVLQGLQLPTHELDAYRYFVGEGVQTLFRRALPPTQADDRTYSNVSRPFVRSIPRAGTSKAACIRASRTCLINCLVGR